MTEGGTYKNVKNELRSVVLIYWTSLLIYMVGFLMKITAIQYDL